MCFIKKYLIAISEFKYSFTINNLLLECDKGIQLH